MSASTGGVAWEDSSIQKTGITREGETMGSRRAPLDPTWVLSIMRLAALTVAPAGVGWGGVGWGGVDDIGRQVNTNSGTAVAASHKFC